MVHRALVLGGLWAVLIAPALCLGGLLSHPCDPHPASDCSHESACAEDPCGQIVKVQDDPPGLSLRIEAVPFPPVIPADFGTASQTYFPATLDPPKLSCLPFPHSDVPLRI